MWNLGFCLKRNVAKNAHFLLQSENNVRFHSTSFSFKAKWTCTLLQTKFTQHTLLTLALRICMLFWHNTRRLFQNVMIKLVKEIYHGHIEQTPINNGLLFFFHRRISMFGTTYFLTSCVDNPSLYRIYVAFGNFLSWHGDSAKSGNSARTI
jgi:hypothetical protein